MINTTPTVCGYPVSCTQYGGLKLVGGPTPYEGQLQICLNGTWMAVCSTGFSVEAAQVACRQMGFGSTGVCVCVCVRMCKCVQLCMYCVCGWVMGVWVCLASLWIRIPHEYCTCSSPIARVEL